MSDMSDDLREQVAEAMRSHMQSDTEGKPITPEFEWCPCMAPDALLALADAVLVVVRERLARDIAALPTHDAGTLMEPGVLLADVLALVRGVGEAKP